MRTPTDLDSYPEWSLPNHLHPIGTVDTVTDSEWYTMQYKIQFSEDQASTVLTSKLYLYLGMLDKDAIIDIGLKNTKNLFSAYPDLIIIISIRISLG